MNIVTYLAALHNKAARLDVTLDGGWWSMLVSLQLEGMTAENLQDKTSWAWAYNQ